MRLQQEREQIVAYGKKMSSEKLSVGTSGNISVYNSKEGLMAITPSGMNYFELKQEDVVVMDLEAHVIEGDRKPSSEWGLHTVFYRTKPDIAAVVHTHPTYSTIFAALHMPLKAVHYAVAGAGVSEIPCTQYRLFGTPELAEEVIKTCGDGKAVLLANHGLITCGSSLEEAYSLTENLEFVAALQYRSMCIGNPVVLSDAEMSDVLEQFQGYGQTGDGSGKRGY